jgi:DHA1 family bicyclomycin/chloramphenicol resistance-like MFS transporter
MGFIAFLSAFVPLSTDLYLPALPGMAKFFGVTTDLANLTLILFFVFFAAGTLFWGPQSDKYGRRPILLMLCPSILWPAFYAQVPWIFIT